MNKTLMENNKSKALKDLYDRYEALTRRDIGTKAKFVRGEGSSSAKVMFVGEAPGLNEDLQGRPFVGRAGQLLNKWLASIHLVREDVYITNIVKCHPMKNPNTPEARGNDRPPTPAEIRICLPIIREEIDVIRPRVIMTLGSPSTRTLLDSKETITKLRGRFFPWAGHPGIQILPTFHPAALFHNPVLAKEVAEDMQTLKSALK